MTITRLAQAGLETRSTDEFDDLGAQVSVDTTQAKSGSYGLKLLTGGFWQQYAGWTGLSTSQFRAAGHFYSQGVYGGCPAFFRWLEGADERGLVRQNSSSVMQLEILGASVATGSTVLSKGSFRHIGVDVKIATSGWVYVYVDGNLEISYTGNTCGTGVIDAFYLGRQQNFAAFETASVWDDVYLDDTAGESASKVPDRRFVPLFVNAAGASTQWDVTGASVNYEAVDDWSSGAHDSDTTYVSSSVNNQVDFYDLADAAASTLSGSDIFRSVIAVGMARKASAGDPTKFNLAIRSGTTASYGSDKSLASSYDLFWERFENDPDTAAAWAGSAAINAAQIGIRSRGL